MDIFLGPKVESCRHYYYLQNISGYKDEKFQAKIHKHVSKNVFRYLLGQTDKFSTCVGLFV